MANNLSDYLENKLLDHSTGRTTYTLPTNFYLALYTATPSDAGGGTEVSGGSYARVNIAGSSFWAAAASGSTVTNAAITFPTASGSWGTITSLGILDASTVGNLLWWGPLTASKTVGSGDIFQIAIGQLSLALD